MIITMVNAAKLETYNSILSRVRENDPELATINLEDFGLLDDDLIELGWALINNDSVTKIKLGFNYITAAGVNYLLATDTIDELSVATNTSVKELHLGFNRIDANIVQILSIYYVNAQQLRFVGLQGNHLGSTAAAGIIKLFRDHPHLTLDLRGNKVCQHLETCEEVLAAYETNGIHYLIGNNNAVKRVILHPTDQQRRPKRDLEPDPELVALEACNKTRRLYIRSPKPN